MRRSRFCLIALLATPAAAAAQEPVPRVHIGAQLPALDPTGAAGVLVELRRNGRESLDVSIDWRYSVESGDFIGGPRTRAFYSLAYKRRFFGPADTKRSWFVTIGGIGYYKPAGKPEILYQNEDGRPFARPIRRSRVIMLPVIPFVGAGIERTLGRNAGVQFDVQVPPSSLAPFVFDTPVGIRAHAGVYVPLGRR